MHTEGLGYEPSVAVVDVLNGAATFDGADSEARRVTEAAHDASLPLQRARNGLVDLGGLGEVHNVDVALGGCDDKQLVVLDIHAVDTLLTLQGAHGLHGVRGGQVEVLDCLIPRAGDEDLLALEHEPANALDARLVWLPCGCRGELVAVDLGEVIVKDGAVCTTDCKLCAVLDSSQPIVQQQREKVFPHL